MDMTTMLTLVGTTIGLITINSGLLYARLKNDRRVRED